jgi:hypothetical protein
LSFVFEQMGRRNLALKCYDELAAVMNERKKLDAAIFARNSVSLILAASSRTKSILTRAN